MMGFSFVSLEWLGWILPALVGFWFAPQALRGLVVATVTFLFLLKVDPYSCGLLSVMSLLCYLSVSPERVDRLRAYVTIAFIVLILIIFKAMALQLPAEGGVVNGAIIPLGLSFYSLRCIHLVLERQRGNIGAVPASTLISYLFFLPTIWVGPINRYAEFDRQNRRHRWDYGLFSRGVERVIYGYVKVVVISGFFLQTYWPYWTSQNLGEQTQLWQYTELVREGLNLYLLFSGYSDVAIGFSLMLGYRIAENFSLPYLARNISEFWRRWHISLTSWSRDYIYNYAVARWRSPSIGVLFSLLTIGAWHELSLRYLAWGVYHWCGIVIWQNFRSFTRRLSFPELMPVARVLHVLSVLLTLHFVWLGFLLVKQPTFGAMAGTLELLFLGVD